MSTTDNLDIPDFLLRPMPPGWISPVQRNRRTKKIPYPRDGYKMFGKRREARERHREQLRRRADRKRRLP